MSLLRAAADRAGCEAILALADIKETHAAYPADEVYGYRHRGWHDAYDYYEDDDDEYRGASDNDREYVTQDLVDSEIALTHWTGPDGARLEEPRCCCARRRCVRPPRPVTSSPTRRSEQAFANRAETSPHGRSTRSPRWLPRRTR